jgi:hypothetical protein
MNGPRTIRIRQLRALALLVACCLSAGARAQSMPTASRAGDLQFGGGFALGRGVYNFSGNIANLAYNIYTFGGGADFALGPTINLRADYEFQNWSGFPIATLHPSLFTIGAAYHFQK